MQIYDKIYVFFWFHSICGDVVTLDVDLTKGSSSICVFLIHIWTRV